MCSFRLYIVDKTTHIFSVSIYGLLYSGFFDSNIQAVLTNSRNGGAGTSAVIRAIIVVSQFDDNPVAGLYTFDYIRPKAVVEGTAAGSSQGMIFDGDPIGIEIISCVISPAPLSVIAIP